ncbi:MAG: AAA family ATPase [Zavarzinella sp.]
MSDIMDEARELVVKKPKAKKGTVNSAKEKVRLKPVLIRMADVEPEEIRWLWPGRLAIGKLSLLAGMPGLGKSFLTCDMAARISRGWKWPCSEDRAPLGDVLLIAGEDGISDTILPRLIAIEADVNRIYVLKAAKVIEEDGKEATIAFDLSNVELIRDALDEYPECKLVVIDPIGNYMGGNVDSHRDNQVRSVLTPLADIAAERGVAVLLVAHPPKSVSLNADDNVLGSRAYTGIVRSVFHLLADQENKRRRLFLSGKSNIGALAPGLAFTIDGNPARVEWELEPLEGFYANDAMLSISSDRGRKSHKRNEAIEWLKTILANGPMDSTDVIEKATTAGFSEKTIQRAKIELQIISRKHGYTGNWQWELPIEGDHNAEDCQVPDQRLPVAEQCGHLPEKPAENTEFLGNLIEDGQIPNDLTIFDELPLKADSNTGTTANGQNDTICI